MPKKKVIHYFCHDITSNGDILCGMLEALFGVVVVRFAWDIEEIVERDVRKDIPILCIFAPPLRQKEDAERVEREVWEKVRELLRGTPALWLSGDRGQDLRFLRLTKVVHTEEGDPFGSFVRAVHKITGIVPRAPLNM